MSDRLDARPGWRRYAAWTLGALLTLVLLVVGVGAVLPVEHQASRRAVVPRPVPEVYSAIADADRYPEWRSGVAGVERLPPAAGRPRYRELGSDGPITYEVAESVENRRYVTRIADPELPFGGTWTFELTPVGEGTEVRITEDGAVYNPLFRFVSRFVMGHTAGIERYLRDLGHRFGSEVAVRE